MKKGEIPPRRRKEQITRRLEPEVLDWYRGQGKGWMRLVDAVLRPYMGL